MNRISPEHGLTTNALSARENSRISPMAFCCGPMHAGDASRMNAGWMYALAYEAARRQVAQERYERVVAAMN